MSAQVSRPGIFFNSNPKTEGDLVRSSRCPDQKNNPSASCPTDFKIPWRWEHYWQWDHQPEVISRKLISAGISTNKIKQTTIILLPQLCAACDSQYRYSQITSWSYSIESRKKPIVYRMDWSACCGMQHPKRMSLGNVNDVCFFCQKKSTYIYVSRRWHNNNCLLVGDPDTLK